MFIRRNEWESFMTFTSKEAGIVVIEVVLAIIIGFLFYDGVDKIILEIREYLPMIAIILFLLGGLGIIIYKRIEEINEDLRRKENKQKDLENAIKRAEDLVDIKAEIKYINDRILVPEKVKNGSEK
tara:strand:+ start:3714 stop:4091 length:378 start_codon:yes stop_codon:yes gene_type:complete